MFDTVFVANRGEIAARIARTCERLGVRVVASSGDFLDAGAQVAQAVAAGAQAVHPGYGFLSENAAFARAVTAAGMTWVGPPPEAMEAMARKDRARELAVAAGVPVVPRGEDAGFPVLVKAAAGGGGKGMRIVRSASELEEARAAAAREAASAFGDDTLLVEKYVERGRHIEVQVLGLGNGQVIHLGTRECSAQRRHQKVIEEAPAPALDDRLRERMHAAAVDLATSVGYTSAGTVEFLLDTDAGEFYFLEMNTRLQVEHPVTEAVWGVDLVELQLLVAAGDPLPDDLADLGDRGASGHAMEARVYAEDPYAGFLPQAGTATEVRWPGWTRVDHALESGQVVSTAFDPMLGKVVATGWTREEARRALVAALDDTAILGLTTNTGFLRELAASDDFAEPGRIDTAWLDRHPPRPPDPTEARQLAAHAWLRERGTHHGPFASDGFRLGGPPAPVVVELDEPVTLGPPPRRLPAARVGEHRVEVVLRGQRFLFERPDVFADHGLAAGNGTVTAPMPGTVLDVRVEAGQQVAEGDPLAAMEAMKMELTLRAPFAGTVTEVDAVAGRQVALGARLFVVEPAATDDEAGHDPLAESPV